MGVNLEYYFAYGSNMNLGQMKNRCPSARFLHCTMLRGYKFVYDGCSSRRGGAVANVVKSENGIVYGALFEVDETCIKKLDRHEGYPTCYQREVVEVLDDKNNAFKAIIYLRETQQEGQPSDEYRNLVLQGAIDCGLPEDYIDTFIK